MTVTLANNACLGDDDVCLCLGSETRTGRRLQATTAPRVGRAGFLVDEKSVTECDEKYQPVLIPNRATRGMSPLER